MDYDESLIRVFGSSDQLAEEVAKEWLHLSQLDDVSHIALSGGSTPKHIFGYIAHSDYATRIGWQKLHFWWGDERCVAAIDEQSNYGEAMRLLFSHVLIPAENLHPIHGELEAHQALIDFKEELAACLPKADLPVFDWILLGLGSDGHTASLFPGVTDYECRQSAVIASKPLTNQTRISLSAQVICAAKRVTFIAVGDDKSSVVKDVINQELEAKNYPASIIFSRVLASSRKVEWFLDDASARKLNK
jgi:6-phosphogluconolactonase